MTDPSPTPTSDVLPESSLQLLVKNPTDRPGSPPFSLEIPPESTVLQLKTLLSIDYPGRPPVPAQRLIYAGKLLADRATLQSIMPQNSDTSLSSSQQQQHTIHLVVSNPSAAPTRSFTSSTMPSPSSRVSNPQAQPPPTNPSATNLPHINTLPNPYLNPANMYEFPPLPNPYFYPNPPHPPHNPYLPYPPPPSDNNNTPINNTTPIPIGDPNLQYVPYDPTAYAAHLQAMERMIADSLEAHAHHYTPHHQQIPPESVPQPAPHPQGINPDQNAQPDHTAQTAQAAAQAARRAAAALHAHNHAQAVANLDAGLRAHIENQLGEVMQQHQQLHQQHHHRHQQQPQQQPPGLRFGFGAGMRAGNNAGGMNGGGAMGMGNRGVRVEGAPRVRQFVFQFEINWSLIAKLIFLVYLLGQEGSPRKVYTLMAIAVLIYLWQTNWLGFLRRLARFVVPEPGQILEMLFPSGVREGGAGAQGDGEGGVEGNRVESRMPHWLGRAAVGLSLFYSFLYGFVCSLLPGWRPQPMPRLEELLNNNQGRVPSEDQNTAAPGDEQPAAANNHEHAD